MTPRVNLIVGPRGGRFPSSNCLLVKSLTKTVLVDAGCGRGEILALRDKIDTVVYTHIHPDHITHHSLLQGKNVYIPSYDAEFESLEELAKRFAPPIWRAWIDYVEKVFGIRSIPSPTHTFDPWEAIRIGDIEIEALPAHGHTKGHHVLVIGNHVHASDIDLTGFGPWYGHPESSIPAFIADITMVSEIDAASYTTSHKESIYTREAFTTGLSRYRDALSRQIASIVAYLKGRGGEVRAEDLVDKGIIYRRKLVEAKAVMDYFEREMIEKILDYLVSKGVLEKARGGYRIARDDIEVI